MKDRERKILGYLLLGMGLAIALWGIVLIWLG